MQKNIVVTATFALIMSLRLPAQTYTGAGGLIPDDGGVYTFNIPVSNLQPPALTPTHGLVQVCLDIEHTYDSDLEVLLVAPDGADTYLLRGVGGDGDNFTGTCFRQDGSPKINTGQAPFAGIYAPQGDFGKFNLGSNGNGMWRLQIHDTYPMADEGKLLNWSITFGPNAPGPVPFPGSDIPLFIVNTPQEQPVDWEKKPAQFKIIDNPPGVLNFPSDVPAYQGQIGIRLRGAFSSILPQKPYLMETWDADGADTSVSLLGLPAENDWILQATYNDKVFLRNTQLFELARAAGQYAPRSRYGELFLNGEYQGIYFICEKIKVDNDRVDLKKMDDLDNAWPDVSGGYIFKHDYSDPGWASEWHPANCPDRSLEFQFVYPKPENITPAQAGYIETYVDSFEHVLRGNAFSDPNTGFRKYADEASFIDYLLLNEAARNGDGFKKSMYFQKDRKGKIKAGPIWDFDWALKFVPWAPDDLGELQYLAEPCDQDVLVIYWFKRMMEDTAFANRAACRWIQLRETILDTAGLFRVIDSTAAVLNQAQKRHYDYWGTLGINVGTPESSPIPTTFAGEIERYKEFFRRRLKWLDDHLPGNCAPVSALPPEASPPLARIYPSLVQDRVFVDLPPGDNTQYTITLTDVQGRPLQQQVTGHPSGDSTFSMEISGYPPGAYFVIVTSATEAPTTTRVVKM